MCDGTELGGATCVDAGFGSPGVLACQANCTFDVSGCTATCDGVALETGEECDGTMFGMSSCTDFGFSNPAGLTCTSDCKADAMGCAATCDGALLEPGEACDGANLDAKTCADFGFVTPAGLACDGCDFDTDGCSAVCGNMVVEPGEACDDGNMVPDDGCNNMCQMGGVGTTCADAITVALNAGTTILTGSTTGGGQHQNNDCQGEENSPDRIVAVTPAQDGYITASLTRPTTDFDAILYALNDCNDATSNIWCTDNYVGNDPTLTGGEALSFRATGGVTYFVVVDGYNGDQGNYELVLDLSGGTCADPVPFPVWTGQRMSALGTTVGAAGNTGTFMCGGNASGEVVYEIQPKFTGSMQVRLPTGDVNYDSVLSVRTDCNNVGTQVQCEHDGNGQESFDVPVTDGTNIYTLVDGWFGATGEYRLRVGVN